MQASVYTEAERNLYMAKFELKSREMFVKDDNSKYTTKVRVHIPRILEWRRSSLFNPIRTLVKGYIEWKYQNTEHSENFTGISPEFINHYNLNRINDSDVYILENVSGPRMVKQKTDIIIVVNNDISIKARLEYYMFYNDSNILITNYKLFVDDNVWSISI